MNYNDMDVAIIDDGVNEGLYDIGKLKYNIEINQYMEITERKGYDIYADSHGTICAAIIRKISPNTVFSSVKILNENSRCMIEQLSNAIIWCTDNGLSVLNISLGSIDYRDYISIKKALNYAYKKGIIIVAAFSNDNKITYPASCYNVIGVKYIQNVIKHNKYLYNNNAMDGIEITANGKHILKNRKDESIVISKPSNSFAAPVITAIICGILKNSRGMTLEKLKISLAKRALNWHFKIPNPYLHRRIDWLENAVVIYIGKYSSDNNFPKSTFTIIYQLNIVSESMCDGLLKLKEYLFKSNHIVQNEADTLILINNTQETVEAKYFNKFIVDIIDNEL